MFTEFSNSIYTVNDDEMDVYEEVESNRKMFNIHFSVETWKSVWVPCLAHKIAKWCSF